MNSPNQFSVTVSAAWPLWAQDLAPRAYVIAPVSFSAVNLTWSFYNGGVNFNGAVPITGATGTFSVPIFTLYHSFGFFGTLSELYGFAAVWGWNLPG